MSEGNGVDLLFMNPYSPLATSTHQAGEFRNKIYLQTRRAVG